jgi:ABC-type transport system involved in multi-copper enzyme maturation permease subunit
VNVWIITGFTLREALRRRVMLAAGVVTFGFLVLYAVGVWFGWRDLQSDADITGITRTAIVGLMLQGGMWSLNFVASLLAIFLAVGAISGEIAQGTMHAVAARPVRRAEIVLGRYLGYVIMLAGFISISSAAVIVTVALITGQVGGRVWATPLLMLFGAAILLAITVAGSARFGTLANGVVVFSLFATGLMGGVIEQIGGFLDNPVMFDIGIATSILLPSRAMWELASSQLAADASVASEFVAGPFGSFNPPSAWMLLVGALYLAAMLGLALRTFGRRDI